MSSEKKRVKVSDLPFLLSIGWAGALPASHTYDLLGQMSAPAVSQFGKNVKEK